MNHSLSRESPDFSTWDSQVSVLGREVWKSWFLSSVATGWRAIKDSTGHYRMALFERSVAGIPFMLFQPPFLQSVPIIPPTYDQLPDLYPFLSRMYLRFAIQSTEKFTLQIKAQEAINFVLPLDKSADQLFHGFSENRKRNIRKLEKSSVEYLIHHSIDALVAHFRASKTANQWPLTRSLEEKLKAILHHRPTDHAAFVLEARDKAGNFLAAGLFVFGCGRITCILGASSSKGREYTAMAGIFWFLIQRHAGTSVILDFEGGQLPGTGRFYREFGSIAENYFVCRKKWIGLW
jgi:hypothetical protein